MFQLFLIVENVCMEMDTGISIFLRCTFNSALNVQLQIIFPIFSFEWVMTLTYFV